MSNVFIFLTLLLSVTKQKLLLTTQHHCIKNT